MYKRQLDRGFTIVELIIVVIVIGILASILIVSYNGATRSARDAALKSDLQQAHATLENDATFNDEYPTSEAAAAGGKGLPKSEGTVYNYIYNVDGTYCLEATSLSVPGVTYYVVSRDKSIKTGTCPV